MTDRKVRLTVCRICRHAYLAWAHTLHCPCCGTVKLRDINVVIDRTEQGAIPKPIGRARSFGLILIDFA